MSRPRLLDLFCGAGGAGIARRFWTYVDKRGDDDCWEWKGSRRANGYGQINIARFPERAHRVSFLIAYGWLPEAVLHKCDNPPCVNPRHLFGGTQADNMADAARKGRVRNRPLIGEDNLQAKLTVEKVREARALHTHGASLHSLARRFGVDRKTITQAVRGERWTHV